MLVRIVRMSFQKDKIEKFLTIFSESKNKIRNFEGCTHLELLQDADNETVFYTYSHWEESHFLEDYRHSELFERVWGETKKLFNEKPSAFSLNPKMIVQ
jgi:heme oxygenase (mycobilin-producing)